MKKLLLIAILGSLSAIPILPRSIGPQRACAAEDCRCFKEVGEICNSDSGWQIDFICRES